MNYVKESGQLWIAGDGQYDSPGFVQNIVLTLLWTFVWVLYFKLSMTLVLNFGV